MSFWFNFVSSVQFLRKSDVVLLWFLNNILSKKEKENSSTQKPPHYLKIIVVGYCKSTLSFRLSVRDLKFELELRVIKEGIRKSE